ncbi:MAG: DUF2442 domain-containing protein [Gammaproteobacteria bacterium]|nr:DUF2442 domain-containing protein [Gammaproteobacteria bacterium]MBU1653644.1 DUF2442 domain-containing protein [Gammaproteobacteria bacterium]MBU1962012.1 DUF2442 domain-containing protein [Gammaproteobacteria bacterium]
MEAVIRVVPHHENFSLELWFNTGDHRIFDVSPYLNRGVFVRLQDVSLFKQAFVALDTVCWPGDLDIAPETLYDRSVPFNDPTPTSTYET